MTDTEIIALARQLCGTPFKEGLALAGVGCDCAGLVEIVLRALAQDIPPRTLTLPQALEAALIQTPNPRPATVVLLQSSTSASDFHCGIISDNQTIIHAHWSRGVVENSFGNWFKQRATQYYSFKGVL